jgi:lipoprotein Spr
MRWFGWPALAVLALSAGARAELSDAQRKKVVAEAQRPEWKGVTYKLGGPYEPGGDKSKGLDCSHYVCAVYRRALGAFPYLSTADMPASKHLKKVAGAQPGDLILFPAYTRKLKDKEVRVPGHVGIVVDPVRQVFVGQQTSTGVAEARYVLRSFWGSRAYEFYTLK